MHVEASTVARILLAGILLKFGVHGFNRFLVRFFFNNSFFFLFVAILGLFFCSLICLIQSDLKSLVAFSSIFHISIVLIIYLIFFQLGKNGAIFIILSHGFVSILRFYFVGEIFHNLGTRLVYFGGGFFYFYFFCLFFFILVFLINRGLPLSLSFYREFFIFLVLINSFGFSFFLVFFVFFFGFYFSLFLIMIFFLGKGFFFFDFFMKLYFFLFFLILIFFFWI